MALKAQGADYFIQPEVLESLDSADTTIYGKGFDFPVIDILTEKFGLKPIRLTEWYGFSRQGIYNALDKRSSRRYASWTGKEMTESERSILVSLIQDRTFDYSDDTVICCCLNNRQDDLACLFVYEEEIKCFFLKDLSEDLQEMITARNYHKYTKHELSGETEGRIVRVMTKPYFLPDQPYRFRANAQLRGMSLDDYARFISGYPLGDFRSVTNDQVTAFLMRTWSMVRCISPPILRISGSGLWHPETDIPLRISLNSLVTSPECGSIFTYLFQVELA